MAIRPQPQPGMNPQPANKPQAVKCSIKVCPDGSSETNFQLDKEITDRLLRKSNGMDPGKWLYENVIYRSIIGSLW